MAVFQDTHDAPAEMPVPEVSQMLSGTDLNGDGIRDDVEQVLPNLYGASEHLDKWRALALAMQNALAFDDGDAAAFLTRQRALVNASACLRSLTHAAVDDDVLRLRILTVDDAVRRDAWSLFLAKSSANAISASAKPCESDK